MSHVQFRAKWIGNPSLFPVRIATYLHPQNNETHVAVSGQHPCLDNPTDKDELPVHFIRIKTLSWIMCNRFTIAYCWWSIVTDLVKRLNTRWLNTKPQRQQKCVLVTVSPHGFLLDGKSYRHGLVAAQTPADSSSWRENNSFVGNSSPSCTVGD